MFFGKPYVEEYEEKIGEYLKTVFPSQMLDQVSDLMDRRLPGLKSTSDVVDLSKEIFDIFVPCLNARGRAREIRRKATERETEKAVPIRKICLTAILRIVPGTQNQAEQTDQKPYPKPKIKLRKTVTETEAEKVKPFPKTGRLPTPKQMQKAILQTRRFVCRFTESYRRNFRCGNFFD